jgi:transposase-like protein
MAGQPKKKADLLVLKAQGHSQVEDLLERGKPIEEICKTLKVSRKALYEWLDAPEQAGLLVRARVRAADHLAAETLTIADEVEQDPVAIQKAKLRADTRKWLASKWNAAQYGDSKGVQVNVNLGQLHLEAVKRVKPVNGNDMITIDTNAAPHTEAGSEG